MSSIEGSPLARVLAGVVGALLGGGIAAGVVFMWGFFHPAMWLLPALGALSGAVSGDRGIKRLASIITLP